MRLLLVEDDAAIREFLKRALVESGYQVDSANDAKTGELKALEGIHDAFIIEETEGQTGRFPHFWRKEIRKAGAPVSLSENSGFRQGTASAVP